MSWTATERLKVPLVCGSLAAAALAFGLARWPLPTAAVAAAAVTALFALLPGSRSTTLVRGLLAFLLTGYAFWGRSFAYLGYRPFFIGDIVLGLVLLGSIINGTIFSPLRSKLVWLLVLFAGWGAVRTIPYLPIYGLDALRDAAIWGYSAFAIVVAGVLLRKQSFGRLAECYRWLIPIYLTWVVVAGSVRALSPDSIPSLGADGGSVFLVKPGDVAVHLAGIGAFLVLGLHRASPAGKRPFWLSEWFLWTVWTTGFLLFGSQNRGGLLSVLIAMTMVLILWRKGRWVKPAIVVLCGFTLLAALDLEDDLGVARRVSPQQLVANLTSITGGSGAMGESTRRWRLQWWQTILNYTVWGDYFWGGKGFGVNLADEDGFQTDRNHALRSAHNGHLTILARSGVPGLLLWILLQGSLFLGLLRVFFRARRAGNHRWAAFVLWILAYWVAFTVNSAFDVYLEGPQGGIWFWTVFGVGLAVLLARPAGLRRHWENSVSRGLAVTHAA